MKKYEDAINGLFIASAEIPYLNYFRYISHLFKYISRYRKKHYCTRCLHYIF